MILVDSSDQGRAILSEAEKTAVSEQLTRLLANAHFSHSKRLPSFLRFVTEQTLAGQAENIKERTLGIEIFGRDPGYDTASDPIVRVTAAEIRKRLALYYQDPAHVDELRITLPSGAYIPQFHRPEGANDPVLKELEQAAAEDLAVSEAHPAHAHRHSPLVLVLSCVVAAALSVAAVLLWQAMHRSALDYFWRPITTASSPVLLCIADQLQYSGISLRDAADPARQLLLKDNLTAVVFDDLNPIVKVAGILQSSSKQYTIKSEGTTGLEDLRSGPTVFIGAFDNAWTLRLTNSLRYRFANNADMSQFRIVDSLAPAQQRWVVDRNVQMATNNYRDYAIVARFTDANTGKLAVVAAGIGRGGTIAAGEFLTDSGDLAELERAARAAGDKNNIEVVLSTQNIGGEPGSPKMEAVYFW
jgi:hypothetical protein